MKAFRIIPDLSKYSKYTTEYVYNRYSALSSDDKEKDLEEAAALIKELLDGTKKNTQTFVNILKNTLPKIEHKWTGSAIWVRPYFQKGWDFKLEPIDDFEVFVGKDLKDAPSFVVFNMGQFIDDILDAGDRDFFTDATVENDYFLLVNVLSDPNVFDFEDRELVLYTARPKTDRSIYDYASEIPTNIFLTSNPDDVEGLAKDLGDRDIYKVKIKQKYLTKTLDRGRTKHYQVVNPVNKKAPVTWIERLTESHLVESQQENPYSQFKAFIHVKSDQVSNAEENKFRKKKGKLGVGYYFSGKDVKGFASFDIKPIQVKIELSKPLITTTTNTKIIKAKLSKKNYDGVVVVDPYTSNVRFGIVFSEQNIKYVRNRSNINESFESLPSKGWITNKGEVITLVDHIEAGKGVVPALNDGWLRFVLTKNADSTISIGLEIDPTASITTDAITSFKRFAKEIDEKYFVDSIIIEYGSRGINPNPKHANFFHENGSPIKGAVSWLVRRQRNADKQEI